MKNKLALLVSASVGLLLLAGCSLSNTPTPTTTGTVMTGIDTNSGKVASFVGSCGLQIYSPAVNSAIYSNTPLVFSGVVDNTNAQTLGCSWTMFEGQAGIAQLYYKNGSVRGPIGAVSIIPVTDWMTTGPVSFNVSVVFDNTNAGFQPGTPMKVTFTEDNPSGQTPDTFDFPLVLQ